MSERQWKLGDLLEYGRVLNEHPAKVFEIAEELLKVRDREGRARPLKANEVQRKFEDRRGQQNIVLKARQMGITTWVAARFFLKTITASGVMTVQVAHTQGAAEGIFRMVQRFWESLPEKLRKGPLRRSRANRGQMRFAELDSEFRVLSAGDEGAGRGLTMHNLHCSEVSRWPRAAGETLAGLRAALAPGGELVIESTPNGAYGCFYDEWRRAEGSGNGVVQHFFPWWMEKEYVSNKVTEFTEEEQRLILTHGLTPEQIGFRRALEASYQRLRAQEFAEDAETCFRATGDCCFEVAAIEDRLAQLREPAKTRRGGALQVWLPPLAGKQYLVAVDTAGGGPDGDFAAMQVIDLESGMQCAELQQRLSVLDQARAAVELAREYGGAMIAVERNNTGAGVLAHLESAEHYDNLYRYAPDGKPGWLTSVASKPGMIGRLGALLVESPGMFMSRRLLGECRTFVTMAGGGTGAANGAHDDCLMAMAIAQAVRAERIVKKR